MRIPITIKIPVSTIGLAEVIRVRSRRQKPPVVRDVSREQSPHTLKRPPPSNLAPYQARHRSTGASAATARVSYNVKTYHITITWPSLALFAEFKRKIIALPKKILLAVAALVIVAIVLSIILGGNSPAATPKLKSSTTNNSAPVLTKGTPSYATILPAGKSIEQLGGWTRISPPDKNPVYTYTDKIGTTRIDVSEQPLPQSFKNDTANQISQLAESYNATDKFSAGNNVEVYVGASAANTQSAILTKNQLLILIKAASPLTNNQWATYIGSLN